MEREERERLFKIIAAVVVIAGIVALAFMIHSDKKARVQDRKTAIADEKREQSAYGIAQEEYQTKCQEWKRKLKTKSYGNLSVVLTVDSVDKSIYEYVYPKMQEEEWKGTLVLSDGIVPGERPEDMSKEEFDTMTAAGWGYAFQILASAKDDIQGWESALDQALAQWEEKGIGNPGVFFCREDQYADGMDERLQSRGIHSVIVKKDKKINLAETYSDSWYELESISLKENYSNVTTVMKESLAAGRSMGVTFERVLETPEDKEKDLSQKKFGQFISQLEDMKEEGAGIRNYQEYIADRQASNAELGTMKEEYRQYKEEKKAELAELKKQEKEKQHNED